MLESKNIFEISFSEMKEINNKYNSKKAILRKIEIEHVADELNYGCVGIIAKAEINIPYKVYGYNKEKAGFEKQTNYKIQTISSSGLWGIDIDSDERYIKEVERKQVNELMDYLNILNVVTDLFNNIYG